MQISSTNILGVNVSAINMDIALATFDKWHSVQQGEYVCVTPVHSIMMCRDDEELRKIYNNAGLVTPDGMPVVWLNHWHGAKHVARAVSYTHLTLPTILRV